jgi:hypothetical protein
MKSLSLWQPWASLVVAGVKTIETRSWATDYRGPLAIHAAKLSYMELVSIVGPTSYLHAPLRDAGLPNIMDVPRGVILGTAELVGCYRVESFAISSDNRTRPILKVNDGLLRGLTDLELSLGDFTPGRFGWMLTNPVQFGVPIPCRGHQRLWEWSEPSLPAVAGDDSDRR